MFEQLKSVKSVIHFDILFISGVFFKLQNVFGRNERDTDIETTKKPSSLSETFIKLRCSLMSFVEVLLYVVGVTTESPCPRGVSPGCAKFLKKSLDIPSKLWRILETKS